MRPARVRRRRTERTRLLVVGHSANRTGAPKVLLELLRWLAANAAELDVTLALGEGGARLGEFRECSSALHVLDAPKWAFRADLVQQVLERWNLRRLAQWAHRVVLRRGQVSTRGFDLVYLNTVASLALVPKRTNRCPVLLHVHELQYGVRVILPDGAESLRRVPDRYLAVSRPVLDMLKDDYGVDETRIDLVGACLPDDEATRPEPSRAAARAGLSLDPSAPIVLASGGLGWRKGHDVFLAAAVRVSNIAPELSVRWIWVGIDDPTEQRRAELTAERAGLRDVVTLVPDQPDLLPYYCAADVLLVPSMEEPFALVALEAALARRPIVCQSVAACGVADLVSQGAGIVAPYLDIDAIARALITILADPARAAEMGERGRQLVIDQHLVSTAAPTVHAALLRAGAEATVCG